MISRSTLWIVFFCCLKKTFHKCSVTAHRSRFLASIKLRIHFAFRISLSSGDLRNAEDLRELNIIARGWDCFVVDFFGFAKRVPLAAVSGCFVISSWSIPLNFAYHRRSLFHRETLKTIFQFCDRKKMQQFRRVHDLQLRNFGALPQTEMKLLLGFNSNHLLNFTDSQPIN